jgi:hypothetical protein
MSSYCNQGVFPGEGMQDIFQNVILEAHDHICPDNFLLRKPWERTHYCEWQQRCDIAHNNFAKTMHGKKFPPLPIKMCKIRQIPKIFHLISLTISKTGAFVTKSTHKFLKNHFILKLNTDDLKSAEDHEMINHLNYIEHGTRFNCN